MKPFTFRSIEKEISFADFTLKNCTIGRLFAHCYSVFVSGDCVILPAYATDNWFSLVYSSSLCCPLFEICLLKSQKSNHFLEPLWSSVSVFNIFTVVIYTIPKLACTQTLFYFSFCSFGKHRRAHKRGEHASEASERKKEFFFPTPTSLRWRSINPSRFFFSLACSTDFQEKIESLWIGYPKAQCLAFHSMNSVLRLRLGIHHALGRNDLNDRSRKSMRIRWKNCLSNDACFDE